MRGTITNVVTRDPVAALTFDDGPHPEYTPLLLHILERCQARATFFMVGESAQRHPELVQQVVQARLLLAITPRITHLFHHYQVTNDTSRFVAVSKSWLPMESDSFGLPTVTKTRGLTPRCRLASL